LRICIDAFLSWVEPYPTAAGRDEKVVIDSRALRALLAEVEERNG